MAGKDVAPVPVGDSLDPSVLIPFVSGYRECIVSMAVYFVLLDFGAAKVP